MNLTKQDKTTLVGATILTIASAATVVIALKIQNRINAKRMMELKKSQEYVDNMFAPLAVLSNPLGQALQDELDNWEFIQTTE